MGPSRQMSREGDVWNFVSRCTLAKGRPGWGSGNLFPAGARTPPQDFYQGLEGLLTHSPPQSVEVGGRIEVIENGCILHADEGQWIGTFPQLSQWSIGLQPIEFAHERFAYNHRVPELFSDRRSEPAPIRRAEVLPFLDELFQARRTYEGNVRGPDQQILAGAQFRRELEPGGAPFFPARVEGDLAWERMCAARAGSFDEPLDRAVVGPGDHERSGLAREGIVRRREHPVEHGAASDLSERLGFSEPG